MDTVAHLKANQDKYRDKEEQANAQVKKSVQLVELAEMEKMQVREYRPLKFLDAALPVRVQR